MRKLVYLVATTVDGFIADRDGSAEAFPVQPDTIAAIFAEYPETCPAHLREPLGITGPARHFDTVIMGYNTHRPALDASLTSAYPHLQQYVVTHRSDLPEDPTVTVVADRPAELVRELKQRSGLDLWLCGGGQLAAQLVDEIDELHLKINPLVLGDGIPLFGAALPPTGLELIESRLLPGGVQLNSYASARTP